MSGETAQAESGWTTDTVHSQIMTLLEERDKRHAAALNAVIQMFETRFIEYSKAIDILQKATAARPTPGEIDLDLTSFKHLVDTKLLVVDKRFETVGEQFRGIQTQFTERDARVIESATAATTAVNAALQAQKEAAGKAEQGTAEQLNQLRLLQQTAVQGLGDKNEDLKERVTRIESFGLGNTTAHTAERVQSNWSTGAMLSAVAVLISLAGLIVVLVKVG